MTGEEPDTPAPRPVGSTLAADVAEEEIASVRDVSFPIVMRGYDRAAVDAYVTQVNRIIAELQVSRSPRSAIRHALDQVSDETRGILERAHETADEITARSRSQADDRLQRAENEARVAIEAAEARVRALEEDADAVRKERNRLLDDVREVSDNLRALADVAAQRFPPEPGEPEARTVTIDRDDLQVDDPGADS
jgi:DivIVA domain-containing protein